MMRRRPLTQEEFERFDQLNHLYASLVRLLGLAKPIPDQSTDRVTIVQTPSVAEFYDEVARLKSPDGP
jgi:hypothetical protein